MYIFHNMMIIGNYFWIGLNWAWINEVFYISFTEWTHTELMVSSLMQSIFTNKITQVVGPEEGGHVTISEKVLKYIIFGFRSEGQCYLEPIKCMLSIYFL